MSDQPKGVLAQHNERKATEPDYYEAAMTAPSITDKTGISAKYLERTAPTVPAANHAAGDGELSSEMIVNPPHPELSQPGQPGGDPADADASSEPDEYDDLKGEALDQAVADANIEGRSSMSADEKRQALRDQAA